MAYYLLLLYLPLLLRIASSIGAADAATGGVGGVSGAIGADAAATAARTALPASGRGPGDRRPKTRGGIREALLRWQNKVAEVKK